VATERNETFLLCIFPFFPTPYKEILFPTASADQLAITARPVVSFCSSA
jgi:hypothetical protein